MDVPRLCKATSQHSLGSATEHSYTIPPHPTWMHSTGQTHTHTHAHARTHARTYGCRRAIHLSQSRAVQEACRLRKVAAMHLLHWDVHRGCHLHHVHECLQDLPSQFLRPVAPYGAVASRMSSNTRSRASVRGRRTCKRCKDWLHGKSCTGARLTAVMHVDSSGATCLSKSA